MAAEQPTPTDAAPPSVAGIRPTPTDEEAAAITAALYVGWPRAVVEEAPEETSTRWRFSGRWWNKPIWGRPQANRQRP